MLLWFGLDGRVLNDDDDDDQGIEKTTATNDEEDCGADGNDVLFLG